MLPLYIRWIHKYLQYKKKMLLNFLKFGLRISLELPINWWQNLYLSSKQATTVLILFQESSRNLMLLFTMDVASSLLSSKLLSFPHGVGLVWEARMSKPLQFLCYILSIDHHLLFWSTAFLKSTDYYACSHMTKMVCCWSESKIPDLYRLLDLYGHQGCILSPCLFNLQAEYIMRNAGLEETPAGIKIAGIISVTSDMQMTPPLRQKVKRNSKASWWKWKWRVKKLA